MEAPPVCEPRSNVSGEVLEYWREQLERARRRVYTQKLALGWLSLTQGGYRVLLTDAEPLVAAKTCWPLSESLESIDPRVSPFGSPLDAWKEAHQGQKKQIQAHQGQKTNKEQ